MSTAAKVKVVDAGSGGLLVLGTYEIVEASLHLPPNHGWGGSFAGHFVRRDRKWGGRSSDGPLPKDARTGVLFTSVRLIQQDPSNQQTTEPRRKP